MVLNETIFSSPWLILGVVYLVAVNVIDFVLFGVDKKKARHHKWRIPEAVLLGFCIVGGSIGGIIGMRVFHHKTKKAKFFAGMPVILLLQIVAAVAVSVLLSRSMM